jgi:hypothetical protein
METITIKPSSAPAANAVKPNQPKKSKKILKTALIVLSVLLLIVGVIGALGYVSVYLPLKQLQTTLVQTQSLVPTLKEAVAQKNLSSVRSSISQFRSQLTTIESQINKLQLLKAFPPSKPYFKDSATLIQVARDGLDASDLVVTAIEPYGDFLGLAGSATDSAKTTNDRIMFLTESIEGLLPHMDKLDAKFLAIKNGLASIDSTKYPDSFYGYEVRPVLVQSQQMVNQYYQYFKNSRPLLEKTGWLLGKDKPRTYFLIFQNDAELRPTGGFWTAYGLLRVDKGKVTPLVSDDIYSLDALFDSTIPAPRPLKAYHINVPYLNLRDMNLSPDFEESIVPFLGHYQKITRNKEKIDAVIAIDTNVLVDLVRVLGRIGVTGWGNFSADADKRCDGCPQIIYQLEWMAGRPRNYIETDRKGFLAPLMQAILSNAMGSEKSKIPPLMETAFKNIVQKHILFYFTDPAMQTAGNLSNITGKIIKSPTTVDYFHLNDANMSSAKTNLFLTQKIKHEIIAKNGAVEHKVSVTYTNPSKASNCNLEKGDLCLNAPKYRDWFRFYTPIGSKMVKMTGSEVNPVLYEELGKQVFEGFYGNKYPLYALSSVRSSIQYKSPVPATANYSLMLQKQPGTKSTPYELWVNGQIFKEFDWVSDLTLSIPL